MNYTKYGLRKLKELNDSGHDVSSLIEKKEKQRAAKLEKRTKK